MRLSQFQLDESGEHRVTFSGQANLPSTLVLVIRPAPPPGTESELKMSVEACLTDERGETLLRVEGPLKEWEAEQLWLPWRTDLALRHPDWKDVLLHGTGNFTLEINLSELHLQGRSLVIRPTLEFRQFSG